MYMVYSYVWVCVDRETQRDRMVLRRMSSCVPHCSHPTVSTRPSAYSGSPPIFQKTRTSWGCGSSQSLRYGLTPDCTCFQSPQFPQTPRSQSNFRDLLHCTCYWGVTFYSASLVTEPLVLSLILAPPLLVGHPLGLFPDQTRRGSSSSLLGLTCSVRLGRGWDCSHYWDVSSEITQSECTL